MLIGQGLKKLKNVNKNMGHFVNLYDMTPEQFMNEYEKEYSYDLDGKVVVSVDITGYEGDKYPIEISGIYFTRSSQKAELSYHGHISFITIKNSNNEVIEILYKDDECVPQSFDDWYENASDFHCFNEYNGFNEDTVMNLINTVIKGCSQDLDIEFKKEDVIILEGL